MIDFNKIYNRQNSESEKWNSYQHNIIPLTIADSDYAVPNEIVESLKIRLSHPIFGYGVEPTSLKELIVARLQDLYNWSIEPHWICFIPNISQSINLCRLIFGGTNNKTLTTIPIYPHLQHSSPILKQSTIFLKMQNVDGRYTPNFDEIEKKIDKSTKLLMLCNPHNPTGIVYNLKEMSYFAEIAEKYNLIICSDDIYSDFSLYPNIQYQPIAKLSSSINQRTITFMSPSKTFNISGLNFAYAIIANKHLRCRFQNELKGLMGSVNILGFIAAEAAYRYGDEWHKKQIIHLRKNAEYCYQRINSIYGLNMNKIEATCLAWIDANKLKAKLHNNQNLYEHYLSFGVAVSDGEIFGNNNFFRLNLATSKNLLEEGLNRIQIGTQSIFNTT